MLLCLPFLLFTHTLLPLSLSLSLYRSSIIDRLMKENIFFTDAVSPQVVVVACRAGFATPLLKKFLEPIHPSSSSHFSSSFSHEDLVGIQQFTKDEMNWIPSFEILGLKYVESIDEFHAKMLTPYDLGDFKWKRSLQILTEDVDEDSGSRGWMFMALRKPNALKNVNDIVCKVGGDFGEEGLG